MWSLFNALGLGGLPKEETSNLPMRKKNIVKSGTELGEIIWNVKIHTFWTSGLT